jgi:mannose-6-phosphate isomerase-like protein (cupin superfamily)
MSEERRQPRRVITGYDEDGRSTINADEPANRYQDSSGRPGLRVTSFWEGAVPPETAVVDPDPKSEMSFVPPPGDARVMHVYFPPDPPEAPDPSASTSSNDPSAWHFDESRGKRMHATNTIEVLLIAKGKIDLVLEAATTTLEEGDVVVQQGTWHAWKNPYGKPCELVGVNLSLRGDERSE